MTKNIYEKRTSQRDGSRIVIFWLNTVLANTFLQKYNFYLLYTFCTWVFRSKGGKKPPEVSSAEKKKSYAQWNLLIMMLSGSAIV